MCINLAYLRTLVKSAVRKFCFGGKQTKFDEDTNESLYCKNELSERFKFVDDVSQFEQLLEPVGEQPEDTQVAVSSEDLVSATIDEIISRAEMDTKYKFLALDLWKRMHMIEKFTSLDLETQAAGSLYGVAIGQFMYRQAFEPYSNTSADLTYSKYLALKFFRIKDDVEWNLEHFLDILNVDATMEIAGEIVNGFSGDIKDICTLGVTAAAVHIAFREAGYDAPLQKLTRFPHILENAKDFVTDYAWKEELLY